MSCLHVGEEHRAHCLVRNKDCVVNKPRGMLANPNPGALVIAHAGNSCQAWSQEGKRARASHESQVPLAAWVASRKHLCQAGQKDMFFEECIPLFDVEECLREPLRGTHRVIKVVMGPRLLGWPTCRERLLSAGLSLRTPVWVGPQTDEEIQDACEVGIEGHAQFLQIHEWGRQSCFLTTAAYRFLLRFYAGLWGFRRV